jgi:biotin carboxylase
MATRPQLVIVYRERLLTMSAIAAARGLGDVIWLLDERWPIMAIRPMLERFGAVVPVLAESPERIAEVLRPLAPSGIFTFTDEHIGRLAQVAELLELPYFNSSQTGRNLADKLFQRQALAAGGVWTPPVLALSTGDDPRTLAELAARAPYPAVLKPRVATGSRHAFKVADARELLARLSSLASGPPEAMVLEGFMSDGPPAGSLVANYVSVESLTFDGEIRHLTTNSRLPMAYPLRETAAIVPSMLTGGRLDAVLDLATRALRAVGVRWGPSHTEIKLTADGPAVIEVNGRIGGGVAGMLKLAAGLDFPQAAMRVALGVDPDLPAPVSTRGVGYYLELQPPTAARRIRSIAGLETLRARPGVAEVTLEHEPGAALDPTDGSSNQVLTLLGLANDHQGVIDMNEHMYRDVQVEYEYDTSAE